MIFDPVTRKYIDDYGRVLTEADIRKLISHFIDVEREHVVQQAERVATGELSESAFFDFMVEKIHTWHQVTGLIAYGGESQMDEERWARIDKRIASELEYLDGFKQEAGDMDSIAGRAGMYADAAYGTYANNVTERELDMGVQMGRRVCEEDTASCDECVEAASTYFSDLSEVAEIGSLQCLSNCRCYIEYAEPIRGLGFEDLPRETQTAIVDASLS